MTYRFIVAINDPTTEQRNSITNYVSDQKYGYWHWYQDFWLLTTRNGDIKASTIRDSIQSVASGVTCFVLPVEGSPESWAAFGKKEEFKWLHETWVTD